MSPIHRLSVLLGEEPGALRSELEKASPIPSAGPEVDVGLPSDLLKRRPDIRRSEAQLAAATARIGEAKADLYWVGDLMLECNLTVDQPKGQFWMEVNKGVDRFQARFDLATGVCSLYRNSNHADKWELLGTADTKVKAAGSYRLRFANYDERLTVWVGRDLPFEDGKEYTTPAERGPDTAPTSDNLDEIKNNDLQPAGFCSVGAAVQVHNIKLWRDTYYTGSRRQRFRRQRGRDRRRLEAPRQVGPPAAPQVADVLHLPRPLPLPGRQQPRKLRQPALGPGPRTPDARPGAGRLFPLRARGDDQVSTEAPAPLSGEITIRVRYAEVDRMGFLHHSNYLVYFEQGRTELLRSQGYSYRDLEDRGFLLVLTRVQVRYKRPALYDDLLTLRTTVVRTTLVKIEHRYELLRDGLVLAEGETTLGCVDREGRVQPLPEFLQRHSGATGQLNESEA